MSAPDLASWTSVVQKLLDSSETVTEGKTTRLVHVTDPPDHGRWTRSQPKPGPLPMLVLESEIAKDAKTIENNHYVNAKECDAAMLSHMARVVVLEARREHAKGIALKPLEFASGSIQFSVVLVK
jgi:hypothetical protein